MLRTILSIFVFGRRQNQNCSGVNMTIKETANCVPYAVDHTWTCLQRDSSSTMFRTFQNVSLQTTRPPASSCVENFMLKYTVVWRCMQIFYSNSVQPPPPPHPPLVVWPCSLIAECSVAVTLSSGRFNKTSFSNWKMFADLIWKRK